MTWCAGVPPTQGGAAGVTVAGMTEPRKDASSHCERWRTRCLVPVSAAATATATTSLTSREMPVRFCIPTQCDAMAKKGMHYI